MKIPASLTIAHVEGLLARLAGSATDTTITLPTHSRHDVGGGEAALVQLLATWAQSQNLAKLATHARGPDDPQLESLPRQLFGLCAALLCDAAVSTGGDDVRGALRQRALERLALLQGENPREASRGSQIEILSVDHIGKPAPKLLYDVFDDGSTALKGRSAFLDLARLALRTAVPEGPRGDLPRDFTPSLAGTLYELFRNTDEHARHDALGNHLRRSVRGIQIRYQAMLPDHLIAIMKSSPPFAEYFGHRRPPSGARQVRILELSVFDSGPGLGPKWCKTPLAELEPDREFDGILACFRKHASSKSASATGLGLPNVIDILRQRNGFIRIRTGRHSLYADLSREGAKAYEEIPDLKPWNEGRRTMPPAAGTLLTLLLPLEEAN